MGLMSVEGGWTDRRSALDGYKEVLLLPCLGDRQNCNLGQEVMEFRWGQTGTYVLAAAPQLLPLQVTTCPKNTKICNKPIFK
jgi:hypothetical protein